MLAGGVLELTAGDDKASVEVTDLTIGNLSRRAPAEELTDQLDQLEQACAAVRASSGRSRYPTSWVSCRSRGVEQPTEAQLDRVLQATSATLANLATIRALNVECNGDTGTVTVVGASALGSAVPLNLENVEPNTELFPDNPLLQVTLNRQTEGPRGAFTVDGLVVSLAGGQAEAVIASTTCGEGIPQSAGGSSPEAPTAPAPIPQQGSAPVTG